MSTDFLLRYPPTVRFGWGAAAELPALLRNVHGTEQPRTFVVSAGTIVRSGQLQRFRELCGPCICGTAADVPCEPTLAAVDRLTEQVRETAAEVLVAVGGGSVIDAVKAAAILVPADEPCATYFHGRRPLPEQGLPVIALPTTAGTGAEVTSNSVLTDPQANVKKSLRAAAMVPAAALVDPELTLTAPPALTAASGLDALTQALEAYLSRKANAASRPLAAAAVARLLPNLASTWRDGTNRNARTAVAAGSLLSAMAFSQSGLGAVHGLAHPLGLALGLPHGLTCAILLPHMLEWNAPVCGAALDELARLLGCDSGEKLRQRIAALCRELQVPAGFGNCGLHASQIETVVTNCRSGSMKANPRHLEDDDVRALLDRLSRM